MVAVVTGAAGFIGRVLVAELVERGHDVVGIDRLPQSRTTRGTTHLVADLLGHDPAVASALASAETVYHLAGCGDVRDPRPDADMHRFRDNGLATAAVLSAVPAQTTLLVASSSSVYGGSHAGRPSDEQDVLDPRGGYARSKVLVEQLCAGRANAHGRITVFRPFTVAGEGQRSGMAFSQWISAAKEGRPLRLLGSPERSRDITDVHQVARALIDLASARYGGEGVDIVNIGTGTGQRLGDLVAAVGRALGVSVDSAVEPAEGVEVEHTLAATDRLRERIGWVPHTDIDDLVARQIAATERHLAASAV